MSLLIVFAASILGGLIQTTTGFGFGVFVMMFFPLILAIPQASALSSMISFFLSAVVVYRYKKYVNFKLIALPAVFYCILAGISISIIGDIDTSLLKAIFGVFLIIISIYFIFFAGKLKIKASILSASICGSLSGLASGFFGIGGPPIVIYLLAATDDDKNSYLCATQLFFALTTIYSTYMRIVNGIITTSLLPLFVPGLFGMLIGNFVGGKIVDKINIEMMKKLIYILLGISGVITLVGSL